MKCTLIVLFLIFAGGLVILRSPCTADEVAYDPPYPGPVITLQGGIIAPPAPQESIRMDLMEIKILLKLDSYVLDAVFHLFNSGKTTTEWVGFPKHGMLVEGLNMTVENPVVLNFISLDGWVDGRKIGFFEKRSFLRDGNHPFPEIDYVEYHHPIGETRWMAKQVTFPEQAATTIRIKLEAPYEYAPTRASLIRETACFFFGPGKYWKGKIGRATILLENTATTQAYQRILFECPGRPSIFYKPSTRESCELTEISCDHQKRLKFGHFGDWHTPKPLR